MTQTKMAGVHDTAQCDCELCKWADPLAGISQPDRDRLLRLAQTTHRHDCYCLFCNLQLEQKEAILNRLLQIQADVERGVEVTNAEVRANGGRLPQYVSIGTVRAAIADVIDDGDPENFKEWLFYQTESDWQTERRVKFLDAVEARLKDLEARKEGLG